MGRVKEMKLDRKSSSEKVRCLFREFQEEISGPGDFKRFNKILKRNFSKKEIRKKGRCYIKKIFFKVFEIAIERDSTFRSARLVLDMFLARIKRDCGVKVYIRLRKQMNKTFPRFFKNIIFEKHKIYKDIPIFKILEQFQEVFGDIFVVPRANEIRNAIQNECKKRGLMRIFNKEELMEQLDKSDKLIILMDSCFILSSFGENKEELMEYMKESGDKMVFLITAEIFDEITFHIEILDRTFLKFMRFVLICDVNKEQILNLRRKVLGCKKLRKVYYKHNKKEFMNELSLVVLGNDLKGFSYVVVTHDYSLLEVFNYFGISCSYQMGGIADKKLITN